MGVNTNRETTKQNDGVADPFMTTVEASAYLAIPVPTLKRWRRHDAGPPYLKHGNVIRYRRSSVDAWAETVTRKTA